MAAIPIDPEEVPRFKVRVDDGDQQLFERTFATIAEAEAFVEECTDDHPGRRASVEALANVSGLEEEDLGEAPPDDQYPRLAGA